ncbi:MAG: response regulator [Syntrophothermus sp.]|uniref:Transcriptional regulatory protein n=1 Tax=Pelotomaculum thermopropionicum (strain DSM 13744 / JCM 10971 / SI) TaxID=370438 RepID=A5D2L3_PELTS|nr:response regulator [Syntrophothermus sp.]NSW82493.1 response regulator [Syntrophothermus sp.]BAF59531.1 response regulator [Pelotomaculum thermopropionicum SI]
MSQIGVLIVEDDPMVVEVNRGFINAVPGFKVVGVARSGREAIEMIKELSPDLVLLDIYLPDVDGLTTLQEIRRIGLPTDVIIVTAAQDAETIQRGFRYGSIDYIIKPFKFTRLKAALNSYATLYNRFRRQAQMNQAEIDSLTLGRGQQVDEGVPKGLNEVTLKQVFLYLLKEGVALSAEEVAEGVGLARVTARRYLDYMEKSGKVVLELQYGSVGRPVNRYRIKE